MERKIILTESDLNRIVIEALKREIEKRNNDSYHIRMHQKGCPRMILQEQNEFDHNIISFNIRDYLLGKEDYSDDYNNTIASKSLNGGSILSVVDGGGFDYMHFVLAKFIVQLNGEPIAEIINYTPPKIWAVGKGDKELLESLFEDIKSIADNNCGCWWAVLDDDFNIRKATFEDCFDRLLSFLSQIDL